MAKVSRAQQPHTTPFTHQPSVLAPVTRPWGVLLGIMKVAHPDCVRHHTLNTIF